MNNCWHKSNDSGDDRSDTDECNDNKMRNMCIGEEGGGICLNSIGSYNCSCAKGYRGDGFRNGTGCVSTNSNSIVIPTITGSETLDLLIVSIILTYFLS